MIIVKRKLLCIVVLAILTVMLSTTAYADPGPLWCSHCGEPTFYGSCSNDFAYNYSWWHWYGLLQTCDVTETYVYTNFDCSGCGYSRYHDGEHSEYENHECDFGWEWTCPWM